MKRLIRRLYYLTWAATIALLAAADRLSRRPSHPLRREEWLAPRRCLVIRLGLLGDGTALLAPALLRLKEVFPAAEVHVLATPAQQALLEPLPFVDRVLPWTAGDLLEPRHALRPGAWRRALAELRELRRRRYDLVLSCYGPLASALALASGARHRLGYATECFPGALTHTLHGGRYQWPWHEVDYNVALVEAAASRTAPPQQPASPAASTNGAATTPRWTEGRPARPQMRLAVTEQARQAARQRLQQAGLAHHDRDDGGQDGEEDGTTPGRDTPLILLHPGAVNGAAKRWPAPYWAELARRLIAGGAAVALIGGPDERPLSRQLAAAGLPGQVVDLVGQTTLPELLAVLERADAVVSGDSGPLHLAVALGRPVVAIHGPTDPAISGPYLADGADATRQVVVRHELPCAPCYTLERVADCPLGHTLCQRLIEPARVYQAVSTLLKGSPTPRLGGGGAPAPTYIDSPSPRGEGAGG
ncbi:MAG TPA: glycosyltransferase family 9 protein [Chloroflexota bacterium]|nr:glycosyltransferase family 9 protein [Chloroflexota bacterium]